MSFVGLDPERVHLLARRLIQCARHAERSADDVVRALAHADARSGLPAEIHDLADRLRRAAMHLSARADEIAESDRVTTISGRREPN